MRKTLKKAAKRFTVVSVPGRTADGSDAAWFCYDRLACGRGLSRRCGSFEAARDAVRKLNADAK